MSYINKRKRNYSFNNINTKKQKKIKTREVIVISDTESDNESNSENYYLNKMNNEAVNDTRNEILNEYTPSDNDELNNIDESDDEIETDFKKNAIRNYILKLNEKVKNKKLSKNIEKYVENKTFDINIEDIEKRNHILCHFCNKHNRNCQNILRINNNNFYIGTICIKRIQIIKDLFDLLKSNNLKKIRTDYKNLKKRNKNLEKYIKNLFKNGYTNN